MASVVPIAGDWGARARVDSVTVAGKTGRRRTARQGSRPVHLLRSRRSPRIAVAVLVENAAREHGRGA